MSKDSENSISNIMIAGAGSIGTVVGVLLKQAGYNVWFYRRNPPFGKHPIKITGIKDVEERIIILGESNINHPQYIDLLTPDLILITSQRQQLQALLQDISKHIHYSQNTIILSMQNGINNADIICEFLTSNKFQIPSILTSIIWWSATLYDQQLVYYHKEDRTAIGIPEITCEVVSNSLTKIINLFEGIVELQVVGNIENEIRHKLILNVISPVLALTKRPYPQALNDLDIRKLVHYAFDEAVEIAQELNWDLKNPALELFHDILNSTEMIEVNESNSEYVHKVSTQISTEKHGGINSNARELVRTFVERGAKINKTILHMVEELKSDYQSIEISDIMYSVVSTEEFKEPYCILSNTSAQQ